MDLRQQARRQGEKLTGTLLIRRARPEEAGALTDLVMRSKAHWGYDDDFMALCLPELTVQPAAIAADEVWVAEEAAEGDAPSGILELVPGRDAVELRLIFVAPERMGRGIGAALWRHAEHRTRALGGTAIELDADPNAVPFYERMGMAIVGERPSGSIPGRRLPRMRKVLAEPDAPLIQKATRP